MHSLGSDQLGDLLANNRVVVSGQLIQLELEFFQVRLVLILLVRHDAQPFRLLQDLFLLQLLDTINQPKTTYDLRVFLLSHDRDVQLA